MEMTNLRKMIRHDLLEIGTHDVEMIEVAEDFSLALPTSRTIAEAVSISAR